MWIINKVYDKTLLTHVHIILKYFNFKRQNQLQNAKGLLSSSIRVIAGENEGDDALLNLHNHLV